MDKNRLVESLRALQAELAGAEQLDNESRAAIEHVVSEIQQQLARKQPLTSEERDSLADKMQGSMLEFETEHPRLTDAVNQVAAALANLGI